jgi:hypothetical protein
MQRKGKTRAWTIGVGVGAAVLLVAGLVTLIVVPKKSDGGRRLEGGARGGDRTEEKRGREGAEGAAAPGSCPAPMARRPFCPSNRKAPPLPPPGGLIRRPRRPRDLPRPCCRRRDAAPPPAGAHADNALGYSGYSYLDRTADGSPADSVLASAAR